MSNMDAIFASGGEMGARTRAFDWSATPLGDIDTWPQSLRSAMSILMPSSAPMILFWGSELISLYNDAYRPVLASKHPHVLGLPGAQSWSEIWDDQLGPLLRSVVNSGQSVTGQDVPFNLDRHGYREETYFDISYNPVRDESDAVAGVFCIVSETTGRVQSERRLWTLRNIAARMGDEASLEEAVHEASMVLAENPNDLPSALICLLEGKKAHVVACYGLKESRVNLEEDHYAFKTVLESGQAELITHADGTKTLTLPLWSDGQVIGFLVVGLSPLIALEGAYRDFLDLLQGCLSRELDRVRAFVIERARAEALTELDRAKTEFFSNVSHEFRTPLTLMIGPLEGLIDNSDLPPAVHDTLVLAHRNSLRLLKLVNTLLDFARIQAARADVVFQPVDLPSLTADLVSVFRSAVEKAGLRLNAYLPPLSAGEPVYIDRDMWEKIVLNLLSNALKHTFEGEIEVRLKADAETVTLTVRDTGTGIPADELPRIFERFHRVRDAQSRTHEGSGIGLALVQEVTRLHGGTISVESTLGVGSTFTVTIPRGSAHLPPEQVEGARRLQSTALGAIPYVEEALRWLPDNTRDTAEMVAEHALITPVYVPPRRFAPNTRA